MCDDWDIQHHIRAWHRNVGYVGQKVFLTDQNVLENVAFGVPASKIDRERVRAALRMASALEFCEALPEGLSTELKGGAVLSGGQAQRIAIARAVYEDPEVIVFDEATAALDNTTEREISDAIAALGGTKTVICVAHRLSTIKKADCIYFLSGGRIAARGRYEQLLLDSDEFREMAEAGELTGS
jgi:ABC-type multidrug transport system fused ATPase/permease subunit